MIRALSFFLLVTIAGCTDPTVADGSCVAVVNVNDVIYGEMDLAVPEATVVSSEAYLTIKRNTGCQDEGPGSASGVLVPPGSTTGPGSRLAHGESNFLPVGTTLYQIEGFTPEERLAYWAEVIQEWRVLAPHPAFLTVPSESG